MASIKDPTYPEADSLDGVKFVGYRPKPGEPETEQTVRVPATLFPATAWPFQAVLAEDEDYLHVYTLAGVYKGSLALVDLGMVDL